MSTASDLERQMLALINAERAQAGLPPVQLELNLNEAAEDHSQWMLNTNRFDHTGAGGSQPWDRMEDAGFNFAGNWRATENIAWQSVRGEPGLSDDVVDLHNSLMNSPGHRANILDPNVTLVGIGIEVGNFDGYNAIIVTQNFARTTGTVQLDTGGSTPAPAPAPAPAEPGPEYVNAGTVGDNGDDWFALHLDQAGSLEGRGGSDTLNGANGGDFLHGGTGNDTVVGYGGNDVLIGGQGTDLLRGGGGDDFAQGGRGNDRLHGGNGNDLLLGGTENDQIQSGYGNDTLRGGHGQDDLFGGAGNDILYGGRDDDDLTGGSGSDLFVFTSGTDTVLDFSSDDYIDLRGPTSITGYSDLMNNHISQSGSDVVIDDGNGNSLILANTQVSELTQDFFLF